MSGSAEKGPGIATAANVVTIVRVMAIFVWLAVAQAAGPALPQQVSAPWAWTAALFILIASTDSLDGHLARSRNEVTDFGKFLDPIADKLVVVASLLVLMAQGLVSIWVVVIVVSREFLVSGLRMVVASKGVVVAASGLGKAKTATTMGAVGGYLVALALPQAWAPTAWLYGLSWIAMAVAVALTVWSGADYLIKCWKHLS